MAEACADGRLAERGYGPLPTLGAAEFVSASLPQELACDEVHLWFFPQSEPVAGARSDHARLLRQTLAAYLGRSPEDIELCRNEFGKPYLAGDTPLASPPLQFNLSHSGGAMLLAVSAAQPLGVDLESPRRSRPFLELAQRFFSHEEASALAALAQSHVATAFLDLWSAKEAVLKALGRGIAFGLERLSFALDDNGQLLGLARIAAEAGSVADWQILRVAPAAGFGGALAWNGPARAVRCFRGEAF